MKLIKNINVYAPEHLGNKDVLIIGDKIAKKRQDACRRYRISQQKILLTAVERF